MSRYEIMKPVRKSQLAVEHSYRVRDKSPSTWVFWVHASSTTRFIEDYRKIAERVKLPGWDQPDIDILLLVYTWLCDETNGCWLMIIDNADDEEVFTVNAGRNGNNTDGSMGKASTLLNSIPQSANGSILITSRNRDVAFRLTGDYAAIIKVGQMDQMEALALLQNQLERNSGKADADQKSGESDDAKALVEALDYMPLAISQAAAYISQRAPRATVSKYLLNLRKGDRDRARLLQIDLGDTRRDGTASNSVITTWQISFAHIHREKPSATQLLSLMSLFNPQGIPEYLLDGRYHEIGDADADFEDDLNTLLSFSLIATDTDGQHFQMHRLVQYSTTTWLDLNGDLIHWKEKYVILMSEEFPESNPENWNTCQDLFPHVQTTIAYPLIGDNAIQAKASLLTKAMVYAYDTGYYPTAQDMGRNALDVRQTHLGAEHPDTLSTVSRLATALRLGGQYDEAEDMFRRALRGREKVLSPDDPLTLSDLNDLGVVLSERGNYEEAETCHRRALQAQEKVLGLEHESTLQSLGDLGCILTKRGKYEEAERLHRRALQIEMKIFGSAHKTSLASMDNLGLALGKQGKFDEAQDMHRRALEASEKALGETHPDTLICARNLAAVLNFLERHEKAESLHRRVLGDSVKMLGGEHPFALYSFCNLGSVLHAQGKYEEAEAMHREALARRTKVLGSEHPHTLSSMHNLAMPLKSLGSDKEAISLMEECYRMRKRVLGATHPDTLKSFKTLSEWTEGKVKDVAVEEDATKLTVPSDDSKRLELPLRTAQIILLLLLGGIVSFLL